MPYGEAAVIHNSSCARNKKVARCALMGGEGKLNHVIFPKGEKSIRKGVAMRLNAFFLTLGPAEDGRGLFIAVIMWLAFPLLCEKREKKKKRCGLFFGGKKRGGPHVFGLTVTQP